MDACPVSIAASAEMPIPEPSLDDTAFPAVARESHETVQVNLGYRCNQKCRHCHVNAGPKRREVMGTETIDQVVAFLKRASVEKLDLTGGAPELNPGFCRLVDAACNLGIHVIDRCNLSILEETGFEWLAGYLAERRVEIIASLPCYLEENVDRQRGAGVFATSIRALRTLNALGYAAEEGGRVLNLVYNPQGPSLPPPQEALEHDYKDRLAERFGIRFNRLYTLTNMPIQRFGQTLVKRGIFQEYMELLRVAHREENLEGVMCRRLISVDWRGYLYDCDFNQMLGIPLAGLGRVHVRDLDGEDMNGLPVAVAEHCFGCTAGQGSSCGGALGTD
jgi:radical SAM/Cys-rich protein